MSPKGNALVVEARRARATAAGDAKASAPKGSNCLYKCQVCMAQETGDGGSSYFLACPNRWFALTTAYALRCVLALSPRSLRSSTSSEQVPPSFHHHRVQHALRAMAMGVRWPLCLLACLLLGAGGGIAGNGKRPLPSSSPW